MNTFELNDIVKHFAGQANTIAVPAIFKKWLGSYNMAVLLSQIIYWSNRTDDENGWFFKSYKDWENEICLTEKEARNAIEQLEKSGLIETKVAKILGTPTKHFRLNFAEFQSKFVDFLKTLKNTQVVDYKGADGNLPKGSLETYQKADGNLPKGSLETYQKAVSLSSQKLLTNTTNTHTARARKPFPKTSIPVAEPFPKTQTGFTASAFRELERRRLDSPFSFPDWERAIRFVEERREDDSDFVKCLEWFDTWAKFTIKPQMVCDHFNRYLLDKKAKTEKPDIPEWQKAINNCHLCDEKGSILINGKHEVCKHQ